MARLCYRFFRNRRQEFLRQAVELARGAHHM